MRLTTGALCAVLVLTSCSGGGLDPGPAGKAFAFDLVDDPQGWVGLFANYPVGEEAFHELAAGHRVCRRLSTGRGALYISGNNHSGDLNLFWKRRVDGRACQNPWAYRRKTLTSRDAHWIVRTDAEGGAWLRVGTRSGFEATTELYYLGIETHFGPSPDGDCGS